MEDNGPVCDDIHGTDMKSYLVCYLTHSYAHLSDCFLFSPDTMLDYKLNLTIRSRWQLPLGPPNITGHPDYAYFILIYPVIVDNIHPKAYWDSIHLLVIFLPHFAMVSKNSKFCHCCFLKQ